MGYLHDDGMNGVGSLGDEEDRFGKEILTAFGRKYTRTRTRLSRLLVSAQYVSEGGAGPKELPIPNSQFPS
jgi:hypothetical protein